MPNTSKTSEPRNGLSFGSALALVAATATLCLAATGKLGLYIHPRYFVFTVAMAVVCLTLTLLALLRPRAASHGELVDPPSSTVWAKLGAVFAAVLLLPLAVLPPVSLSTERASSAATSAAAASSAGGGSGAPGGTPGSAPGGGASGGALTGAANPAAESPASAEADAKMTVPDWSALLQSGIDPVELSGRTPQLSGFITADANDPENIMQVTRYTVTCCVVDAAPRAVPVYLPGWQSQYKQGKWYSVTGYFSQNPSALSTWEAVVIPGEITAIPEPKDPYVPVD